jgi:hypothetical protein
MFKNTFIDKKYGKKLYFMWYKMIRRCYNTNEKAYINYGGRGIKVCDEWVDLFEPFYEFAITHGYEPKLEIDRINNNGNYEPCNVRFVTRKINTRNMRGNVSITIGGETKTFAEWGEISGVSRKTIAFRYKNGFKE